MDQTNQPKAANPKPGSAPTVALRVKRATKKKLATELARINKKEFGRRVRADELIQFALALVDNNHVAELQERSLSNADRLEQRYQDFVKANGPIAKDVFLGKLLAGELPGNSANLAGKSVATEA